MESILVFTFWSCVLIITYIYVCFPLLVFAKGVIGSKKIKPEEQYFPFVSFCIAAYNEEHEIAMKITNLLEIDYPKNMWEAIIGSDGSTDGTNAIVSGINDHRIKLLALQRQGKNLTLNSIEKQARGEVLIFTDADALLDKYSIRKLVRHFADKSVGGVAGNIKYYKDNGEFNKGEKIFWKLEHLQKKYLVKGGNVTSATGQLYAIRKKLYQPIPRGVTDDFVISAQVVYKGYHLLFEQQALAYCKSANDVRREFKRKVRVVSGGLRGVWLLRGLCNPFRYGFFALQLFSHKVLRRLAVLPILIMLIINPFLLQLGYIYKILFMMQLFLHSMALIGYLFSHTIVSKIKIIALPLFFDMVNVAALFSLWKIVIGKKYDLWNVLREDVTE